MRLLLVSPANRSYVVMPSLGLGYLAAVSRRAGHDVRILNCLERRMSFEDFARFLRANPFDVIGFQVYSYDLNLMKRYLAVVREAAPGAVILAGGPHPSADPEGTLAFLGDLTAVFVGEAEIGLPLLLDRLAAGATDLTGIPGIALRTGTGYHVEPPALVDDLDSLPAPAWDLIRPEDYPEAPHGAFSRRFPTAPIIVTRGCPHRCTFCAGWRVSGTRVRKRSIGNVIEEIRALRARGIREVHIEDENFLSYPKVVTEFCERLLAEKIDITWSLPSGVRIDSLRPDLLRLMEASGCYSLALGIEFGTQRLLDLTDKKLTIEVVREKLSYLAGSRIRVTGFFLLGLPGESIEEMEATLRFSRELPLDRAQFNLFMPLPGSRLWEELEAAGKLKDIEWDRFFVHDVAFVDAGLSAGALKRLQRRAYLGFYLRPRILAGLAREIRSPRHLAYLLRRLFDALR